MTGLGGGFSAKEMQERHQAEIDASECVTRCAFCNWTYTGTVHEGRELAKGHRRVHHPNAIQTRRRRSGGAFLGRWQHQDDGYRAEGLTRAAKVRQGLQRLEEA